MSNNKWMDDPVLEGISKERLEVLLILSKVQKVWSLRICLHILSDNLTWLENKALISQMPNRIDSNVLKEDMSPEEIKRVDMVKQIVNSLSKKRKH